MQRILGLLLVPFLLVGLIWLATVIYLQQSAAQVDGNALLLHFVYIPLAAVALWFAGKAAFTWLTREPATSASPATAPAAPLAQPAATPIPLPLAILAAEFSTPGGDWAEQVLPELREGKLRPELADDMLNAEGLPVSCARHADLDTEAHQEWLEKWLHSASPEHPSQLEAVADGARLLALLDGPLTRSLDTLAALPPLPLPEHTPAGTPPAQRPLLIKLFAPAPWQDMLTAHLRERLTELSGFAIGFIKHDAQRPELHHDPIRVADAFALDLRKNPGSQATLMLVACDSLSNQARIDQLEAEGRLFSASTPDGLVPGESAAILLAAAPSQIPAESEALARLERSAWGARQKPVDARGRTDAELLGRLLPELLEHAGLAASEVCGLSSDCDQRAAWFTEAATLMSTHLPELDPVSDHLSLGRSFGHTGHAGPLLALVMAAHTAQAESRAVLAAALFDPVQRSLAVLRPWQVSAS
ncbi:hypothetical protein [Uliginosibacterium sp. TH139]|uniref:hypothetical protein n=1 Tax=Uliginosibacterium sp. TH139 TaxID=2067453 RepID=UPI0013041DBF|nr:hypothetical protein [Uliginosibacterium sp. TH139]